jgi:hypothetical protein
LGLIAAIEAILEHEKRNSVNSLTRNNPQKPVTTHYPSGRKEMKIN